jgi:hypothetical protein
VVNFEQPATQLTVIEVAPKKVPPMTDQWNEVLRCPQCSNTGMASLSHPEGAEMPTVNGVPDGFKAVQTKYGPNFHCGACNVPAEP